MAPNLVPTDTDLVRAVQSGMVTYDQLLDRLAQRAESAQDGQQQEAATPKSVVLSTADKKALRTLPAQLADLELPDHPRELSVAEREHLVPLFDQVKAAKAAVTKAEEALKEAMHGHIDATTGEAERDKNGHKLTEGEVVAPSYAKKVTRGLVGGKSVEVTDSDLQAMLDAGEITRRQYLRMTQRVPAVRTVVPDAVMAEVQNSPELLAVFARRLRRTGQTTAIRMAKN